MIELPAGIDRDAQLLDLDRVDAEESMYEFFRGAWPYIDAAPWVDGWCMEAIAEHLEAVCYGQIRRLIVNISPRCSKSNLVSVGFPAWVWAQPEIGPICGPRVPFLHASYANQLSLRDSVKCRRLIESPWYQARWGHRFRLTTDQNTKSRFTNDQGGERLITSIEGTNTGEGGMCFVAGTMVSAPDGPKPIESLRPGDSVLSFDVQREKVVPSRVIATARRTTNALCTIRSISGHRIICTEDHPIYSPGRGFIRADEVGKGDRLLIRDEGEQRTRSQNGSSDLRQLRRQVGPTSILGAQGTQARKSGRLLLQKMLLGSSCLQKFHMLLQGLWKGAASATSALLLRGMQARGRKLVQESTESLRDMRRRISAIRRRQEILLKKVRRRCSFETDARVGKLKVPRGARASGVLKSFSGDAGHHSPEGRALLHELQSLGSKSPVELSTANLFARSPYRRGPLQQRTGEFDYALRALSSFTPSWHVENVSEISKDCGREVSVYDIQIEGQSNFFAEGILVHNCIIIDDPNSVDDVDSEATIQTAIDWWTGTMPTRLNNQETGAYIIIQQRTFENDLTGHILETEGEDWVHLMIPMRYEPERSFFMPVTNWKDPRTEAGELMWPARFSEASVKRLETRLGPFRAAGQLQQRPEPAGGGIILREWWKLWEADSYPPFDFVLGCLDTAFTEDEINDPSGMIVWGIFSGDVKASTTGVVVPKRPWENSQQREDAIARPHSTYSEFAPHVMCMWGWDERLKLHELVNKVAQTCVKMKVDLLLIENKASGISVADEIRRLYSRERFGVQLFDPKSQDKLARLVSVQHLFAEGIIYGPDRPWMERVISQVGQFPKGKHDEYVDLTSMGLRKLRDMGLLVRQPERDAELEAQKTYPRGEGEPLYPV